LILEMNSKIKDLNLGFDKVERIHHLADIHFRNFSRHKEYKTVLDRLYKKINKNASENSLITVLGDVAHSKTEMSPELVKYISGFLKSLNKIRPTILIPGNHDCFTGDHEVLTHDGWISIRNYVESKKELPVATFNDDMSFVEFQEPNEYVEKEYSGELVHLEGKEIDMKVTPTHRVIHQYSNKSREKYYVKNAENIKEGYLIPITGMTEVLEKNYWASLLGFAFADGCLVDGKGAKYRIQFRLKKKKELNYLSKLLNELQYDANFRSYDDVDYQDVSIYSDLARSVYNYFDGEKEVPWDLVSEDKSFIKSFLDGYLMGDGSNLKKDYWEFLSINKKSVEVLATAARIVGAKSYTSFHREVYGNYENSKRQFPGAISFDDKVNRTTVKNKSRDDFEGKVYCLDVPNNNLLIRRNDKTWITGNCNVNNQSRMDALTPIVENLDLDNLRYIKKPGLFKVGDTVFSHFSIYAENSDYVPASDIPDKYRKVALYHGTVDRSVTDHGYVLKNEDMTEMKFVGFNMALLGDIHKRQKVSEYEVEEMVVEEDKLEDYLSSGWKLDEKLSD